MPSAQDQVEQEQTDDRTNEGREDGSRESAEWRADAELPKNPAADERTKEPHDSHRPSRRQRKPEGFELRRALLLVALLLAPGCDCDESIQYAIQLAMADSISGEPVVTEITAVVSDGSFSDGVTYTAEQAEAFGAEMSFARERAGTYQVEVTADGYQPWIMTGVNVTEDECHVETVQLIARLQPIPVVTPAGRARS